jgi:hypothetical protein
MPGHKERELKAFIARKVSELDKYNKALEKREEDKALINSGKIIKEEFIANALSPAIPARLALILGTNKIWNLGG